MPPKFPPIRYYLLLDEGELGTLLLCGLSDDVTSAFTIIPLVEFTGQTQVVRFWGVCGQESAAVAI